MHRLFLELLPGGAPVKKTGRAVQGPAGQGAAAGPGRKDPPADGRRGIADLARYDIKLKVMKAELKAAVLARGSRLMDIHGIGPAGAARILADVGDVARFPDRNHFASWTGTAPIDASSGEHTRHRLSRAGNRRLNHVLYMAGIVQLRNDTPGRACYRRKRQQSKTSMEAMRCLRRRLSDVACRQLAADAAARPAAPDQAGPGGHPGTTLKSSAADLTPDIGSSDQPLPGPAPSTLPPAVPARNPPGRGQPPHSDDAPEASTWSAPPDERH